MGKTCWVVAGLFWGCLVLGQIPYVIESFPSDAPANGSSGPAGWVEMGGEAFFFATDGIHGYELWATDGTSEGTRLVSDANPGPQGCLPYISQSILVAHEGMLVFLVECEAYGRELWKTDGTREGTQLLVDLTPGTGSTFFGRVFSTPMGLIVDDGTDLLLMDLDGSHTPLIPAFSPNGMLYFDGLYYFSSQVGLYRTDGTPAGTEIMTYYPTSYLFDFNGQLVFVMDRSDVGRELFTLDSGANVTLVKDIRSGGADGFSSGFWQVGDRLLFTANDGSVGSELWVTDGTEAGTLLVRDIYDGSSSSYPEMGVVVGSTCFFAANDGVLGKELWKTDGTEAGTQMVLDLAVGSTGSSPYHLMRLGGEVLFCAKYTDPISGRYTFQLWKSDGDNCDMIAELPGDMQGLGSLGSQVFLTVYAEPHGSEPWVSDGTPEGTQLLRDINPTPIYPPLTEFQVVSGGVAFRLNEDNGNSQLWSSKGWETDTIPLVEIGLRRFASDGTDFFSPFAIRIVRLTFGT